jgi:RHS repeat-associated protein
MSVVYTNFAGMLVHEDRGGVETEYVPDTLGSAIGCLQGDATSLSYRAEYWPYGEIQAETGTNPSPWGFVGLLGYLRDLVKLLYVRARYYQPTYGRWLTVDPWWPVLPAYDYVLGLPVSLADPNGLSPICQPARCDCHKACDDWMKSNPKLCGSDYPPPAPPGTKIGGFALCCDTVPCSCVCPGNPVRKNPITSKCFDAHEFAHITPGACASGYTGYPKNPPNTGTECAAQMAEIKCLWGECEGKNLISNDCFGATNSRCWLCKNMLKEVCGKNLVAGFYEKYCARCSGIGT